MFKGEAKSLQALSKNLKFSDIQNNGFRRLAKVLEDNFNDWQQDFPDWVGDFMDSVYNFVDTEEFNSTQLRELYNALRKYLMRDCWAALRAFRRLAQIAEIKTLVLGDEEVYQKLQKAVHNPLVQKFLYIVTDASDDWQLKLIKDTNLIKKMLAFTDDNNIWNVFANITQHPDAKTLLPKDLIIEKASKSSYLLCVDICALLCSEKHLQFLKLDSRWIANKSKLLHKMLTYGTAEEDGIAFGLTELILPIANLAVADSQKDLLGKTFISLLLHTLVEPLPNTRKIEIGLKHSKQEAARALWNLVYTENNRNILLALKGIEKLTNVVVDGDPILQQNINGILHMLTEPTKLITKQVTDKINTKGHIMISYNWGNQPTVKRIAKTLQDNGYHVWLDVEQMNGSTLEAMASAVEGSALILMCMSQKYKDSPNCRLEGEYCVNRKVPFLPLMMQQGYRPDGWLGIALGSKLYYDFSNEESWDIKMFDLIKAIGGVGKGGNTTTRAIEGPKKRAIEDMTLEEIHEWMTAGKIAHYYEVFMKQNITGFALAELKRIHAVFPQKPTLFLHLCGQLGITDAGAILLLSSAVHKLGN